MGSSQQSNILSKTQDLAAEVKGGWDYVPQHFVYNFIHGMPRPIGLLIKRSDHTTKLHYIFYLK